jgi:hypothetical protein
MPIYSLMNRNNFQRIGIVALGRSKTKPNGDLYPEDLTYFNLDRAEMLKKTCGEQPTEIPVMFMDDDIDKIIPHHLKMYAAGRVGPDGKRTPGKLMCKSAGPRREMINGELVESPGDAEWFAQRDPTTGVVPIRPCLGSKCPDFVALKCKPSMNVLFIAPLYSYQVGFSVHTGSWRAIESFLGLLTRTKEITGGRLRDIPFKIVRRATTFQKWDPKQQKDVIRVKHIMYLEPYNEFFEEHKIKSILQRDLLERLAVSLKGVLIEAAASPLPVLTAEAVVEFENEGQADHYPAYPEGEGEEAQEVKRATANEVADDPEVQALFAKFEAVLGKKFDRKNRLIAIRRKEDAPDLKAAVVEELTRKIAEAEAARQPKAPQEKPEEAV